MADKRVRLWHGWAVLAIELLAGLGLAGPAWAGPGRLPADVWMNSRDIPMYHALHWGPLAPNATPSDRPTFTSANLCLSIGESVPQSPQSESSTVESASGWSTVEVIAHWPGDASVTDQYASSVYRSLRTRLDHCFTAIGAQVTVADLPFGHSATVMLPPQGSKQPQYRLYVVAPPGTGTVAELTVTNTMTGAAGVPWIDVPDEPVLQSLAAPICRTAKSSC